MLRVERVLRTLAERATELPFHPGSSQSLAPDVDHKLTRTAVVPVFPKKDSLPGSQAKSAVQDRD